MHSIPNRLARPCTRFSTINIFRGYSSRDKSATDTRNADLRTRLLEELKISLKVRGFLHVQIGF
jgi:hypothetical protein